MSDHDPPQPDSGGAKIPSTRRSIPPPPKSDPPSSQPQTPQTGRSIAPSIQLNEAIYERSSSLPSPIPPPPSSARPTSIPPAALKNTLPSSVQKALLTLDKLKAKLDSVEKQKKEPIAIIGMACRFPGGGQSPDAYFQALLEGVDAVSEVPADRWKLDPNDSVQMLGAARWGAFLKEGIKEFDPSFFGISPREAERLDPQQRMLLELTWEALENAGQVPLTLVGSRTGVFVGLMTTDYMLLAAQAPEESWDGYAATGSAHCFPAGRIAYTFGFQGPTMVVDTACSSSLVAAHLACQALRNGECDMAVVGGVNLMLSPVVSKMTAKMNALSPDGHCKTFDSRANGYVRGEGGGVLIVKRLSDAQRDGDPIAAVIRGSAVNQDGRSTGMTTPNVLSQQAMLRQAFASARVTPEELGYIEAHGTGTPLGDPIETEALRAVLGAPRQDGYPCILGAVKTNIGHLEAAAGVAGLIKTAMVLERGTVPKNLHLKALNPRIAFDGTPFILPTDATPWPRGLRSRIAGVSSFGLSGTNAHLVLEEAPVEVTETDGKPEGDTDHYLLPLSAKTPEALRALAENTAQYLGRADAAKTSDVVYTAAFRRMHHEHRLSVVGRDNSDLRDQLLAFSAGQTQPGVTSSKAATPARQRIVFVFSGQGSQWVGMGRTLMGQDSAFRAAIEMCHESIRRHGTFSLMDELEADESKSRLNQTDVLQPTLFAIQIGVAAMLRAWGVEPDVVVGHSMGEVAAARVAGILSIEDATKVICRRARMMLRIAGQGAMAQVELTPVEANEAIRGYEDKLSVAVHNGPRSTVLSGDIETLDIVLKQLEKRGVFARKVKMDVASHSPQVDILLADLQAVLNIRPRAPRIPMFSTVTAEAVLGSDLTAEYWAKNLRNPVLFAEVTQRLLDDRQPLFVEISPHPVLTTPIAQSLAARNREGLVVGTLRRNQHERRSILETLGALHAYGSTVNWKALYPSRGKTVALPTYPWQRKVYWVEPVIKEVLSDQRATTPGSPLLGRSLDTALRPGARCWQLDITPHTLPFLFEHRLQGNATAPGSFYVETALEVGRQIFGGRLPTIRNMTFLTPLVIAPGEAVRTEVDVTPSHKGGWTFQLSSRPITDDDNQTEWTVHAEAELELEASSSPERLAIAQIRNRCAQALDLAILDRANAAMGLDLGPAFNCLKSAWVGDGEVLARVELTEGTNLDECVFNPIQLDACFRAAFADQQAEGRDPQIVAGFARLRVFEGGGRTFMTHAVRAAAGDKNVAIASLDGVVSCTVEGLIARPLRKEIAMTSRLRDTPFRLEWEQLERAQKSNQRISGAWVIVGNGSAVGTQLATQLERLGASVKLVNLPNGEQVATEQSVADALRIPEGSEPPRGVVYIWPDAKSGGDSGNTLSDQRAGIEPAIALYKALASASSYQGSSLYLVTRASQFVDAEPGPVDCAGATLWGLGRAIQSESSLKCTRIDLDGAAPEDELSTLVDELLGGKDDEVALRANGRYAPRIKRAKLPATLPAITPVHPDATYLITGGLGGLGLLAAEHLAEEGARYLILVGRSGVQTESQKEALERLHSKGTRVDVIQADISQLDQVETLFRNAESRMPPIRGILHTAGVLDDGLLESQTWERFEKVFRPKLAGAQNLHICSKKCPLDFFILYSSMSGLLAPPGVANYVAANCYLDALAHRRRHEGRPATSIAWGLFADVGMGTKAHAAGVAQEKSTQGFTGSEGSFLLAHVLRHSWTHIAFAKVHIPELIDSYPWTRQATRMSVLSAESKRERSEKRSDAPSLLVELLAKEPAERIPVVEQLVLRQGARILRMKETELDPSQPLGNYGFDSLMGLEIRNWLQSSLDVKLTMIDIMSASSLKHLVTLVAGQLPTGNGRDESEVEQLPSKETPQITPETSTLDAVQTTPERGRWITIAKPRPAAAMRLFCFPYAGGAAAIFASWGKDLPEEIEVCAVQPPGRHERSHEQLPTAVNQMVDEVLLEILPYLDKPFAVFGHCLGAMVMFETVRRLNLEFEKVPLQIFASGAPAPPRYLVPNLSSSSLQEFKGVLLSLGFADERILNDPQAASELLPMVRSDFGVAERYTCSSGAPTNAPIAAFAGLDDGFAPPSVMDDWSRETRGEFSKVFFPGGHYFIVPEREGLLRHVGELCLTRLATHRLGANSSQRWMVGKNSNATARVRVIVLPGIGQSAATYKSWRETLGAEVELVVIERPGMGLLSADLPIGDLEQLAAVTAPLLGELSDLPYVLFGFDLGALLAMRTLDIVREKGQPLPHHLCVSGIAAPHLHYFAPIHQLRRDFFAQALSRFGIVSFDEDRALRAECAALSRYRHAPSAPHAIPITVVVAEQDGFVPLTGAQAWSRATTLPAQILTRKGHHVIGDQERDIVVRAVASVT